MYQGIPRDDVFLFAAQQRNHLRMLMKAGCEVAIIDNPLKEHGHRQLAVRRPLCGRPGQSAERREWRVRRHQRADLSRQRYEQFGRDQTFEETVKMTE